MLKVADRWVIQGAWILVKKPSEVIDTKKENDLIIHFAEIIIDEMSVSVLAKVDPVAKAVYRSAPYGYAFAACSFETCIRELMLPKKAPW